MIHRPLLREGVYFAPELRKNRLRREIFPGRSRPVGFSESGMICFPGARTPSGLGKEPGTPPEASFSFRLTMDAFPRI